MRDELPNKINSVECGIVNLESKQSKGSHWVCYINRNKHVVYFDSFGNLRPPKELVEYFHSGGSLCDIMYNHERVQNFDSVKCGHLCLQFLNDNVLRS